MVSYRHGDRQVASLLAHGLEQRSFRVWIDTADVRPPGDHWQDRVAEGALNARACVIVVGQQGIDRVQADEVRLMLQRAYDDPDLPIIPVVLPTPARFQARWLPPDALQIDIPSSGPDDAMLDRLARALHGLDFDGELGLTYRVRIRGSDRFGRRTPGSSSACPGARRALGPRGRGGARGSRRSEWRRQSRRWCTRSASGAPCDRRCADPLVMEPNTDPVRTLAVTLTTAGQALGAADTERADLLQATQLLAERMSASPTPSATTSPSCFRPAQRPSRVPRRRPAGADLHSLQGSATT